ncbi:hypothetical protein [Rhodopirellula sp. MGV]|uniref:hypothetical protein n=1 Tax=Rhodopirellula sp. MGV TaxID=2023130 RepID=UPI000B971E3C|nr:hypothetical protein [Rhodopirellula sp. MGV]OYP38849.1 hypothetical protein CGZ80_01115 [Rhodopirellula sp. MGV]PNY37657.1 hypothetical protein C2E31_06840 [Rhodopirellula baltica]
MIDRLVIAAVAAVYCCGILAAEDADSAAQFSSLAAEIAESYTLEVEGRVLELRREPVLTWTDPEHGEVYGDVYVWTDQGRPAAIASIYKWYRPYTHSTHEFQSLVTQPIHGTRDDQSDWTCAKPGVQWKPVPMSPPGGQNTAIRLTQMRLIAKKFALEMVNKDGSVDRLRMLSQPLYRFQEPVGDAVQGALFAFARGTDPEALLLLEFRDEGGVNKLYYSLARSNFLATSATYDGQQVWQVKQLSRAIMKSGTEPYTKFVFQD